MAPGEGRVGGYMCRLKIWGKITEVDIPGTRKGLG